jgi:hypothetical protein
VLVRERAARREVIGREVFVFAFALLEVLLLVVSEDRFVVHRELDALAGFWAAVDEIAREDDAVVVGDGPFTMKEIEQGARFVEAPVQIADDDGSIHVLRSPTASEIFI